MCLLLVRSGEQLRPPLPGGKHDCQHQHGREGEQVDRLTQKQMHDSSGRR